MKKNFVVGLTGGIAGGKTLAADIMAECGAYIIDADVVSREATAPGTDGARALAEAFPAAAKYGGADFDRRRLRDIVFSDTDALRRLDGITHPLIIAETVRRLEAAAGLVVLVVPLLFESGMETLCDYIVTVSCREETRIKRVMRRDTISEELARDIMAAQLTDEERERRADAVLHNDGDRGAFRKEVEALYRRLADKAAKAVASDGV